ncbi:hypothetical protein INN71_15155 [Nocardioides sp. ChNu-153]|uniref:hypothetical protein n=1 Tax=unclassified Nocardioides TaxID=2615069 RepID=UPI002405E12A|nr:MULTISPECIES: hypothetical protein [unclassified Nocardioides]MDF9716311.1 hypothetical protein [Nocardioides sp. ChNu-99]MDN7122727.1 hypothetical protein [Nocardioides sp. ChNu-153]
MSQQPPHSRARRSLAWPLFALATALVGVGAGIAIGLLIEGGGSDDRGERNASTGCGLLVDIDRDEPLTEDSAMDDPAFWELSAMAPLASAAGTADDEYADLAEAAQVIGRSLQTYDTDALSGALDDVADECEALGLATD